ncbi:hypothetical protein H072_2797 [Dactylellina haptotyla CBS 200.50]|uniref:Cwf18 pre-mRNA splicing factor n=1 Tax=Dactylellina haptotyla (strain CBS 200.50) TaxID=1284197 RepID=S8C671_DACHA|nr:hypothetical protein H072_2797 [Dactylellina haptotyla CBS 200.50]
MTLAQPYAAYRNTFMTADKHPMDLSLETQTNARKDRLAKLRNLKRKQEEPESIIPRDATDSRGIDPSAVILSGRNYDVDTKAPKLGFDVAPSESQDTLESQAAVIAVETRNVITDEYQADKPIDLLSLQPKKPNWDLKRDVDRKMIRLGHMTDNAIARLLRDRILQAQSVGPQTNHSLGENLAELVKQKEHKDEADEEDMI